MSEAPLGEPISVDLPSLPEGWRVVHLSVLAGARLAITGVDVDLSSALAQRRTQQAARTLRRLAKGATARVWVFDGSSLTEGPQFPLLQPFPIVEQFPDGRWLVAATRSSGDRAARILSADGTQVSRIELGDGIAQIKIDAHQRIWVGWLDRGVFGNDLWRAQGRDEPPSAHGLAAFDDAGELLLRPAVARISDCYALNVAGDAAWACSYADFPISKLNDQEDRYWSTSLSGARAIAVRFPYVLAAGGYGEDADRATLLRLLDATSEVLGERRLPLGSYELRDLRLLDGRDDEIHAVVNNTWRRWTVPDASVT